MKQPQQIGNIMAHLKHQEVSQPRALQVQSSRESAGLAITNNSEKSQVVRMNNGSSGLSLYKAGELSPECIVQNQLRLSAAFPRMGENFFNLLTERLIEREFSDERLTDAINHLIDNFQYKELSIADVIRFDRVKKLYTYGEYCDAVGSGLASSDDFKAHYVEGRKKPFWVKVSDKYL